MTLRQHNFGAERLKRHSKSSSHADAKELKITCNAWLRNIKFMFQVITIGLLNTVRLKTPLSTFLSCSSRNLQVRCQATRYQWCHVASMRTEV